MIAKTTGTFRGFDGTEIYFESRGAGRPLVLSYGIGCLMNHWRPQIERFAETCRVVTWDYRAHHRSAPPADPKNLGVDALCADLGGLMDHLGLERASHWGHSFGAQMLARFFDLEPGRVANLVFVNGFVRNPLEGMFGSERLSEALFGLVKSGYRQRPDLVGRAWRRTVPSRLAIALAALAGGFNLELAQYRDVEIYARGIAGLDLDRFLALFDSMKGYDATGVLPRITVPTLIVAGRLDSVTPLSHQREMNRLVPGSELYVLPRGSHCSQLDLPEEVNRRIERFLAENP